MALKPPLRGAAYSFEVCLVSQADTDIFQVNPTLAAGDVIVYKDGALDGNIDALPVAIGASAILSVTLSADEMTADRVAVKFSDAAGAQWQDMLVFVEPVTVQIGGLSDGAITAAVIATGAIDADAIADGAIDAGAIATDAITAAKIAADAIGASELAADAVAEINATVDAALADYDAPTKAELDAAQAALAAVLSGMKNKDGSLTYSQATDSLEALGEKLAGTTVTVVSGVDGEKVTILRGDTFNEVLDLGIDLTGYSKIWFTVKRRRNEDDADAILQVLLTSPAAGTDGLQILNGAAGTAAYASLAISDLTAGEVRLVLDKAATVELETAEALVHDVQVLYATGVMDTPRIGPCLITLDVTRATS